MVLWEQTLPNGKIRKGTRNNTLFGIAAGKRGDGQTDKQIVEELHEVNRLRCEPPVY